jgi:Hg(II)-responsive transcriptional regulator
MNSFTVGALADKAGINLETVRYYEKIGLMPKPKRKESHYRIYDENDFVRLKFIIRAKELGFTLKEISELLSLKVDSETKCGDIKKLAEEKIIDVGNKIRDLKNIKKHLDKLVTQCINEEVSSDECPIVKALIS